MRRCRLCHDSRMGITRESGPGIGFWISVALGALAGVVSFVAGAGFVISLVIFVVVSVGLAVMLS